MTKCKYKGKWVYVRPDEARYVYRHRWPYTVVVPGYDRHGNVIRLRGEPHLLEALRLEHPEIQSMLLYMSSKAMENHGVPPLPSDIKGPPCENDGEMRELLCSHVEGNHSP